MVTKTGKSTFAACTIVAHNYLPQARILAASFREHHPESDFYIVVIDHPNLVGNASDAGHTMLSIHDLDLGDEGHKYMAAIYDVTEFATSVKPFALRQLVQHHECVFYIDPDIKIFAPLTPLIDKTCEVGWSLTPHALAPMGRDGRQPSEQEIKGAGIYNLGFIGVTKNSLAMLDWWCERLRRDCVVDVRNQLFTDQRWIDMAVSLFPVHLERTTSYNVAYWNLDQRRVWKDGAIYMVDDDVLRFFHFSGYDPRQPWWISKYQNGAPRVLLSEHPVAGELCEAYGVEMTAIRDEIVNGPSYGWADIVPGVPWTRDLRRYLRDRLMDAEEKSAPLPPTPYESGGSTAFMEWLRAHDEDHLPALPRYGAAMYEEHKDLRSLFPEVLKGDIDRYTNWFRVYAVDRSPAALALGDNLKASTTPTRTVPDVGRSTDGVDVYGYFRAELGVGEAARLMVSALRSQQVDVSTISDHRNQSRQSVEYACDEEARHRTIVMSVNADRLPGTMASMGRKFFKGRHVIGQWFWELESIPDFFIPAFRLVDELWAPTLFIKGMLEAHAPRRVTVTHMPLPLLTPVVDGAVTRQTFGLDERFMFLFTFDFLSVLKRKNALGLIDAYCAAFAEGDGAQLVIKTINGDKRLGDIEQLRWHARKRPDITIIDGYVTHAQTAGLMNLSDCYVSLHRSEGLGLTMAEAMLLGKPVIATAYSGNLDFMNDQTALLVPWERTEVGGQAEGYPARATWAEPDLSVAGAHMRKLFADRSFARDLGERGRRDVEERFSLAVTGARMKDRLQQISRRGRG